MQNRGMKSTNPVNEKKVSLRFKINMMVCIGKICFVGVKTKRYNKPVLNL